MEIVLEVPGQPVPQPRQRFAKRGQFVQSYTEPGHAIHAYRQAIVLLARAAMVKRIDGLAMLHVEAVFSRPSSHWRKHDLKPDAPLAPVGDGDNIIKGIADALTDAGVWPNDRLVVDWRIRKRYGARNEQARTIIRFGEADP